MQAIGAVLVGFAAQAAALAAALWLAPVGRAANRALALALVVIAGMTLPYVLGWTGLPDVGPRLAFLPVSLPLALGPLVYAYVHATATGKPPPRLWLHLLPAAAQLAYLAGLSLAPEAVRIGWKETAHDDAVKPLTEAAVAISLTAYSVAGLRLLARYRRWLAGARSDADLYGARWLGRVLGGLIATAAAITALRLHTFTVGELDTGPLQLWLAGVGAYLGIEGWRHAERPFPAMQAEPPADMARPRKDWAALGAKWRDATLEAGWWREPDLTLAELARRLGTNTGHLSRAVNEGLGVNFAELINRMRAEAVAARLRQDGDSRGDLLAIAFETGFSSKASFNRAFRAAFGVSPSEFRRRLRS